MKKFVLKTFTLFSVLTMLQMLSCTEKNQSQPEQQLPDNSFSYCGTVTDIRSVVYEMTGDTSVDFYFSPTAGIVDLPGMQSANDFIKISLAEIPDGDINLLAEGNSLSYVDIEVSKGGSGKVTSFVLTMNMEGSNLKMDLSVVMASGKTLEAKYDGECVKYEFIKPAVVLDSQIYGIFMGQSKKPSQANDYYFAFTNAEFEAEGTQFEMKSEGYAIIVDFYGEKNSDWKNFPVGTFVNSDSNDPMTFYDKYSYVVYNDASGKKVKLDITGDLVVNRTDDVISVSTEFVDIDGEPTKITYEGNYSLINGTFDPHLPQIGHDVEIDGGLASAIYEGDIFGTGSGVMEITIIDKNGADDKPNAYGVNLALFSVKFNDPKKDRRLVPGTYVITNNGEQGTWMATNEMEFMGMVIPVGTYAVYDDGSQTGQYLYAIDGTITIEAAERNYFTITFDLVSPDGYSIKGSFTGDVPIEDMSNDNDDDGSSTLESDLDMDLSYLQKAYLAPQSEIYVPGLGTVPVSKACDYSGVEYGYQFVDIGLATGTYEPSEDYPEGKLVEGDIVRIDLLVNPGKEGYITPGKYTITPNRYPAQFKPGVAPRGYQGPDGNLGSRWELIKNAIGNGDIDGDGEVEIDVPLNIPSVKGYACLYDGTVTITKSDKGENWFTFEIDALDVLKHKITGTWTGPIYLYGTDTPVLSSGEEFKAPSIRHMPAMSDYVHDFSQLKPAALSKIEF